MRVILLFHTNMHLRAAPLCLRNKNTDHSLAHDLITDVSHWFKDSEPEDAAASFKVVGCGASSACGAQRFV